jgi:hypothetical protein
MVMSPGAASRACPAGKSKSVCFLPHTCGVVGKQRITLKHGWPAQHLEVVLHTGRLTELLHHAAQREVVMETPGELPGRKIAAAVLDIVEARSPALSARAFGPFEDVIGPAVDGDGHMVAQGPFDTGIVHLGDGGVQLRGHELQHRQSR